MTSLNLRSLQIKMNVFQLLTICTKTNTEVTMWDRGISRAGQGGQLGMNKGLMKLKSRLFLLWDGSIYNLTKLHLILCGPDNTFHRKITAL